MPMLGGQLPHPVDEERPHERGAYRLDQHGGGAAIFTAHDDGEFVFFEASEHRPRQQAGLKMLGDFHQHGVAAGPAERVVDLAKAVEIDQRQQHDAGTAIG